MYFVLAFEHHGVEFILVKLVQVNFIHVEITFVIVVFLPFFFGGRFDRVGVYFGQDLFAQFDVQRRLGFFLHCAAYGFFNFLRQDKVIL